MHPPFSGVPETCSLASLRAAVDEQPASGPAWHALGLALSRRGEQAEALTCLRAAVALQPRDALSRVALGEALVKTSAFDAASACFEEALTIDPACWRAADWQAYVDGSIRGRTAAALAACAHSIRVNPNNSVPYAFLCRAAVEGARLDTSLLELARTLPPDHRPRHLHSGVALALMQLGRYDEAGQYLDGLPADEGGHPALLALRARAAHVLGDAATAQARFEALRAHAAGDSLAADEYIRYAWRTGRYAEVKRALLGDRIDASGVSRAPTVDGRRILLCTGGNGYGDEIQWAGVAPLLRQQGAEVMLECRAPVRRLLETIPGVEAVVLKHEACPPDYERYTFFRLVCTLDWTWERLGTQVPYVHVPPAMTRTWRAKVERYGPGPHVGVEWRSTSVVHEKDPYTNRSMPAAALAALTAMPGVTWHALHVGESGMRELAAAMPPPRLSPLSNDIDDFMDTAAAVSALDAVVTVDTSMAHIAGALGTPAFLMLPFYPEWRWGDDASPFGWYPSLRRFRQPAPGDWASVLHAVATAIGAFMSTGPTAAGAGRRDP